MTAAALEVDDERALVARSSNRPMRRSVLTLRRWATRLCDVLKRRDLLPDIAHTLARLPDRVAHGLIVRDLDTWIRLEFLGTAAQTGVADALRTPSTLDEILKATGLTDRDLLEALLALGVSLREVGFRRGRYRIRGRRLRAVAGSSPDLRGVVEELIVYDNPIYSALHKHLRGAPPAAYDAGCGAVIAAASRVAEPVLGPTLRTITRSVKPTRVLDIGCGSGVYLRHMLESAPEATGVGIDLDSGAIDMARELLRDFGDRHELLRGNIERQASELGEFDLVTLLNNVYYWPPDERSALLRTIRQTVAPGGTLVVVSATTDGQAFNRHLDLALRVTSSSHRLPIGDELVADLKDADYTSVECIEPVPKSGLVIGTARRA